MFIEPNLKGERRGWIEVICGSMFSGKTEELIRRLKRVKIANLKVEIFKPSLDVRYDETKIVSHDTNAILSTPVDSSQSILLLAEGVDVVGIDEAQFFDKLILSELRRYLNKGIDIAVSGLDKDYRARPFGIIPNLIEMAHHKQHLKAVCQQCGADAEYRYRMTQNHVLVLIGAENHYEPRCEKCFNINQ